MTAASARRGGAAALVVLLGVVVLGAVAVLGCAGSAIAQTARQLECRVLQPGQSLGAPVTLQEGERVQLVVHAPLLGNTVAVGPVQTARPGVTSLAANTVADALTGVIGGVCRVAVTVQAAAAPVVPPSALPPVPPPVAPPAPLPPVPPVNIPGPGVEVGVRPPSGDTGTAPPATTPPGTAPPAVTPPAVTPPGTAPGATDGTAPTVPGFRFDPGALPAYDFSRTPYGVSSRFGAMAAPAFRFGQRVPGYAPQFGVLDGASDVTRAGDARALPLVGAGGVAPPVVLAVLLLAVVAGALVRTWVLRRAG